MTWRDDNALVRAESLSGNSTSWTLCRRRQGRVKGDHKATREVTTPTALSHKSVDGSQCQPKPVDHRTGPQGCNRAEAKLSRQSSTLRWGWARCKTGHWHSCNTAQEGTKSKGLSLTVATRQSRGDFSQASHWSFTLVFFSLDSSQVAYLCQVRAGHDPRQTKPHDGGWGCTAPWCTQGMDNTYDDAFPGSSCGGRGREGLTMFTYTNLCH